MNYMSLQHNYHRSCFIYNYMNFNKKEKVRIGDPYGIRTRVCMRERHVS
jgi:hypothetical protein